MSCSLQIQTVLYNNEKVNLFRSLDSIRQGIINNRKRGGVLDSFIVSYGDAAQTPLFDDGEIDEITAKYAPEFSFKYTFFNENTGSAKGQTLQGMKALTDYILVMNPDVILSPEFFTRIMEPFSDPDVGISEARQCPIEHAKDYDTKTGETGWATGACSVIPTSVFKQVGGFDYKTFFLYCDDVDISWRIRLLGKKIIYQPLAPVYHAKRLSCSGGWQPTSAEVYYSAEAALFMAYKWSNDALCKQILNQFLSSEQEVYKKAANEFLRRKSDGTLPERLDPDHKVSEFIDGYYTKTRYIL